jgi:indole-3-glycerol phosphate synthase
MILDDIVVNKKQELKEVKSRIPLGEVEKQAQAQPAAKAFAAALRGEHIRLIAEVKKASPSKGMIAADFDPINISRIYAENGAAAISVLTESKYFLGSLDVLDRIGETLGQQRPPLLRKDFLFDPYQVIESRAHGADAVLLIAAILPPDRLQELIELTRSLDMEALVEVHNETELENVLKCETRVIGINNRDLKTFKVDLETTERLSRLVPRDKILVSESGIKTRTDVDRLQSYGVRAVLIGEALMSAADIALKMQEFL